MYRTDIKQHRSLFTNQKFKEGSLALISSKKKIFFFFFFTKLSYLLSWYFYSILKIKNIVSLFFKANYSLMKL